MLVRGGERRDSAWYAVIDDDWPAVRARLEERLRLVAAAAESTIVTEREGTAHPGPPGHR